MRPAAVQQHLMLTSSCFFVCFLYTLLGGSLVTVKRVKRPESIATPLNCYRSVKCLALGDCEHGKFHWGAGVFTFAGCSVTCATFCFSRTIDPLRLPFGRYEIQLPVATAPPLPAEPAPPGPQQAGPFYGRHPTRQRTLSSRRN